MLYHQEFSTPHFEKIQSIFNIICGIEDKSSLRQLHSIPDHISEDEPNGSLRKVANYFLNRYSALTAVTRIPGIPMDTNYVERVIKVIIKLRRESLFFNNASSAIYSGEILTVLETAVVNKVNVFEFMDFLLSHKEEVIKRPQNYLPWLYKWSDEEKAAYWQKVDEIKKSPSNFSEFSPDESYHSSA